MIAQSEESFLCQLKTIPINVVLFVMFAFVCQGMSDHYVNCTNDGIHLVAYRIILSFDVSVKYMINLVFGCNISASIYIFLCGMEYKHRNYSALCDIGSEHGQNSSSAKRDLNRSQTYSIILSFGTFKLIQLVD